MKKLPKIFFNRNTVTVAQELLGKYFITNLKEGKVVGKIVETEAYMGVDDLACHASRGKTPRTKALFEEPGHLYVYLNYGIFWLTNIVTHKKNDAGGVLLRAAEIIEGQKIAEERIQKHKFTKINQQLASGPGKLSVAFGVEGDFHKEDISKSDKIYIEAIGKAISLDNIVATTRIGVEYAKHCKDYPWRFYIKDNKFVSKP